MIKINKDECKSKGMPQYKMVDLFERAGDYHSVKLSYIEIQPGQRVPESGFSRHDADEYSYFISGELFSHNEGVESIVKAGDATLIPRGEEHFCINKSEQPCVIACVMID